MSVSATENRRKRAGTRDGVIALGGNMRRLRRAVRYARRIFAVNKPCVDGGKSYRRQKRSVHERSWPSSAWGAVEAVRGGVDS